MRRSPQRAALAVMCWSIGWAVLPVVLAAKAEAPSPLVGFDAYVAQAVADWQVPGLAVAVVNDGETVFARGYGVRALGSGDPVDAHTRFAIGSTTKAMTAAALGMLVDEGAIGWDDKVIDHLSSFRLHDPYTTRETTVRDLLSHRAGLGNADFLWYEQTASRDDVLRRLRRVEPAYSMRASFIYQNVMYAAAGEVVRAVSGRSFVDFLRERLFAPLAMQGTVALLDDLDGVPNVARPHFRVDGEIVEIENASVDVVAAAGSVWSSVSDMARWIALLLSEGTVGEQALLEPSTVEALFTPTVIVPRATFYPTAELTRPQWTTYGLGWFQADYRGRKIDFHTGSIDGMVAIVGLDRAAELGIVVLANLDHAELRHALMYRVLDLFSDAPARDWSGELRAFYDARRERAEAARTARETTRVDGTQPRLALARYAGRYEDPLYGVVDIEHRDGRLHARYGRLEGPAEHWHYDTFRIRWSTAWRGSSLFTFRLDARGEPTRLDLGGAELTRRPDPPTQDATED